MHVVDVVVLDRHLGRGVSGDAPIEAIIGVLDAPVNDLTVLDHAAGIRHHPDLAFSLETIDGNIIPALNTKRHRTVSRVIDRGYYRREPWLRAKHDRSQGRAGIRGVEGVFPRAAGINVTPRLHDDDISRVGGLRSLHEALPWSG